MTEFVLQCIMLPSVLHKVGTVFLHAAHLWPVRHTFALCRQRGWDEDEQEVGKREEAEQWLKKRGQL